MKAEAEADYMRRVAMKTSETLYKAADLIDRQGWGTGSWSPDGPLCIEGAVFAAAGVEVHHPCPAYNAVREYLSERITGSLFGWNDRLATTRIQAAIDAHDWCVEPLDMTPVWDEALDAAKAEVIAVLRAAALIEAAKENPSANPSPDDIRDGLLVEAELGGAE